MRHRTNGLPADRSGTQHLDTSLTRIKTSRDEAAQTEFGRILEVSANEIYVFDADTYEFLLVNRGARENLGYSMQELQQLTPLDLKPEFTRPSFVELIQPLQDGTREIVDFETVHRRKDGSQYPVEVHLQLSSFHGSPAYVAIIQDITRRQRAERELQGHKRALELLASAAPLDVVMRTLVEAAESANPGMLGSVLILDRTSNRFVDVCAPSLPDFYNEAVEGLAIGDGVGSCGTAAYTAQRVIVEDVMTHPYWVSYRDITEKAGLRACWSEPIISTKGDVLGTFAMYYRQPRGPNEQDLALIHTTAHLAAIAIEQRQNDEKLKHANDQLEFRVRQRTAELEAANQQLKATMADLKSQEKLLRTLIDLQEQERQMVAHDIHDGFVQDVVGAHLRVQNIDRQADPAANEAAAEEVAALLRKAIAEGRRLIRNMRPIVLDDEGIVEAIRHLIADEKAQSELVVAFHDNVQFVRLEPRLEAAIFRIVQEALNNVRRHAKTNHAAVELTQQDNTVNVFVRDQGVGFDTSRLSWKSFGLRGIRERARLFGGTAEIESAPGCGTTVHAQFQI